MLINSNLKTLEKATGGQVHAGGFFRTEKGVLGTVCRRLCSLQESLLKTRCQRPLMARDAVVVRHSTIGERQQSNRTLASAGGVSDDDILDMLFANEDQLNELITDHGGIL